MKTAMMQAMDSATLVRVLTTAESVANGPVTTKIEVTPIA